MNSFPTWSNTKHLISKRNTNSKKSKFNKISGGNNSQFQKKKNQFDTNKLNLNNIYKNLFFMLKPIIGHLFIYSFSLAVFPLFKI